MSCNPIYADETIQLHGVIFCGGKSSRMGEDKGLKLLKDSSWSELAMTKLEQQGIPTYVSINSSQKAEYDRLFEENRLIIDNFPLEGPLNGLLSAHNTFPDSDLFVLACDLVDISENILIKLLEEFRKKEGEHDFFVFKNKSELEPLCGIYTREGLRKIFDLYTLGKLEKHSMKYILEIGNTYALPLSSNEEIYFTNYNSPSDFQDNK